MRGVLLFFLLFTHPIFADLNLTAQVQKTIEQLGLISDDVEENSSVEIVEADLVEKLKVKNNELKLKKQEREAQAKKTEEKLKKAEEKIKQAQEAFKEQEKQQKLLATRISMLLADKAEIDKVLSTDNIWVGLYRNHETYQILDAQQEAKIDRIKVFKSKSVLTQEEKLEYEKTLEEYQIIEGKLSQLKEYKDDPFEKLIASPEIGEEPTITNPLDIITAMSFKKQIKSTKEDFEQKFKSLNNAVIKLLEKTMILQELVVKTRGENYTEYVDELRVTENKIDEFEKTLEIFKTSVSAFDQKVSQINLRIDDGISREIKKSIITGSIILFILLFFFFIKYLVKKYMSDNELFYGTNKVINFLFILLVLTILLFTYLENVGHLVTVLSFASAGIAIALKDWFMSLMGWFVILVSGSIHVGDRVKFVKDGVEYVGDIVDISVLRMTMHEDVTLTTVMHNKRSGRIIFIPNNYVFTDMIANYSHSGLKTVWDGIELVLTYDSNISKAQYIAKEVTRKYSKGYTDMTRKQLNRLRSKYSMRNTAVEPRIFAFLDTYGVKISAWYLTNSYATLTLRSTISMEILARIQEEDDIHIALPSQSLYMDKSAPRPPLKDGEEPTEEHRPN